ncbi:MobC family plasmid mobilization relaxosome protein [Streptomyces luteosporeus]|uniref:Bacterial mobilisation domain-containing protein n=1 Tax=Streptomyces luteosporeus TaxID=173856 RepID=A0ABP6GS22_9ACTN
MAVKRTRFLGIRVTDGEYQQLLERCNGRQLAVWMRETCLDTRPARSLRLPSIDPVLLRQLAGMGNNLNQIARKINGGQWSGADRVQVVAALVAIDAELERLRHAVLEKGADDDR